MNYLAHLFLSGESNDLLAGNFMGDAVKGNQFRKFPESIQQGILLHRKIDFFTDNHPIVKDAINLFKPLYARHTGIFTDILYDHFLSISWKNYHQLPLNQYIDEKMKILATYYLHFPARLKSIFPMMYLNQWFKRYQTLDGIDQVMLGMSKHTSFPGYSSEMKKLVISHSETLLTGFHQFMNEIQIEIQDFLQQSE